MLYDLKELNLIIILFKKLILMMHLLRMMIKCNIEQRKHVYKINESHRIA